MKTTRLMVLAPALILVIGVAAAQAQEPPPRRPRASRSG